MVLLGVIMLAAAAARFYHLGAQPLWLDEALTRLYAGIRYQGAAGQDIHPPFYFSLVRLWMHGIAGLGIPALAVPDTEFFLRAPSGVLGVLTVPLVFAIGRVMGGTRLGLLAALLFAVHPFQVQYGQEARMYALLTFLATLAMWGVASLLGDSRRVMLPWFAIVAGSLGALYTHNTAVILLVSWNLVIVVCLLAGHLRQPKFVWHWSAAVAAILVGWIPWLPRMLGQAQGVFSDYWIPAPDLNRIAGTLGALYVPLRYPFALYVATSIVMIGLWVVGLWQWRRDSRWLVFLVVLIAVPITLLLLVSLVQPVFLARALIWTTIPFSIAVAAGTLSLESRPVRSLVLLVVVSLSLLGLADYYASYQKESWDKAAAYVAENAEAGDVILIHKNYVKEPFNYYFRRHGKDLPQFPLLNQAAARETQIQGLPPHNRIWLVASHGPLEELHEVLRALVKVGKFREEKPLVGINVFLFDTTSRGPEAPGKKP